MIFGWQLGGIPTFAKVLVDSLVCLSKVVVVVCIFITRKCLFNCFFFVNVLSSVVAESMSRITRRRVVFFAIEKNSIASQSRSTLWLPQASRMSRRKVPTLTLLVCVQQHCQKEVSNGAKALRSMQSADEVA